MPAAICVVTYDLGFGKTPLPKYRNFSNDDNSVAWQLQDTGRWSMSSGGVNCGTVPPPTLAPPVPAVPPAKTVAKTIPPPTSVKVTTPAPTPAPRQPAVTGPLAFTGFGPTGRLLTLIGMILVVVGAVFYFVDVRKRRGGSWACDVDDVCPTPTPRDRPVRLRPSPPPRRPSGIPGSMHGPRSMLRPRRHPELCPLSFGA